MNKKNMILLRIIMKMNNSLNKKLNKNHNKIKKTSLDNFKL